MNNASVLFSEMLFDISLLLVVLAKHGICVHTIDWCEILGSTSTMNVFCGVNGSSFNDGFVDIRET